MESAGDYRPFNVNMGFFIALCGMGLVYMPLVCELTANLLASLGFWDRLKGLPSMFQVMVVVSMFIGVGVIAVRMQELVRLSFESLFGAD